MVVTEAPRYNDADGTEDAFPRGRSTQRQVIRVGSPCFRAGSGTHAASLSAPPSSKSVFCPLSYSSQTPEATPHHHT